MTYGLIGERLGHSFSREIHAQIADYDYELLALPPEQLTAFFAERSFRAINVTIPYKETVMPLLDEISDNARKIGAVNTVVNLNGRLLGYNTDYCGAAALLDHLGVRVTGKKVLILGTGGTAKTMTAVVRDRGAGEIIAVSRRGGRDTVTYAEAVAQHADAQVLINTTPVGMYPDNGSCPIDLAAFAQLEGVVDVIYNPLRTGLVQQARARGLRAGGGLYMLAAQAVYASALFLGETAREETIDRAYQAVLRQKSNIVLIGMPSCGKTSVGRRLPQLTGKPFCDTDDEIIYRTGQSIPSLFATGGEAGFRQIEREVIADTAGRSGVILATGGGAILDTANVRRLAQNGVLVFLDRSPEHLQCTADRPLSADADALAQRYRERYPLYMAAADIRIEADGSVETVADRVMEEWKNEAIGD